MFIFFPFSAIGQDIKTSELKKMLEEREKGIRNFILIDVRTPEEHKGGYIPGTDLNIPYDQIEKLSELGIDKKTTLILYCRSGRRAEIAKSTLLKMGYRNVINAGGVKDWIRNGYKLTKP